jgi:TonB family protein
MTSVFALSHKINRGSIDEPPKIIFVLDVGFSVPRDPVDPAPAPGPIPVPIPGEEGDDPDDYIDNFLFEPQKFNFIKDPVPPIDKWKGKEVEVFPYIAVQEKPEMTSRAKTKLSNYIYSNYPPLAMRSGVSGVVVLDFICSKEGLLTQVRLVKENPKDMGFGKVALEAIKQVSFKPGLQRDKPVSVRMQVPIRFSTR